MVPNKLFFLVHEVFHDTVSAEKVSFWAADGFPSPGKAEAAVLHFELRFRAESLLGGAEALQLGAFSIGEDSSGGAIF